MSDLVDQLLDPSDTDEGWRWDAPLRNEAANEIERLRTENKRFCEMLKIQRNLVDQEELLSNGYEVIAILQEALEGWMIDHGDRCRICMERSQAAIKEASFYLRVTVPDRPEKNDE